jgi:hypothetical protein
MTCDWFAVDPEYAGFPIDSFGRGVLFRFLFLLYLLSFSHFNFSNCTLGQTVS